jgi:hypothetical protein
MVMPMNQTPGLARSSLCESNTLALSGGMSAWFQNVGSLRISHLTGPKHSVILLLESQIIS